MKYPLARLNMPKRYLRGRPGTFGAVAGPVKIEADGDGLDSAALSSTTGIQVNMIQSDVLHKSVSCHMRYSTKPNT